MSRMRDHRQASSVEALEQQMLSLLKRETLVGGKRVTRQELPELSADAAGDLNARLADLATVLVPAR